MVINGDSNLNMGEKELKVKNTKVLDFFNAMKYGENIENLNKANDWLKSKNNTFFTYVEKSGEPPNGSPTILHNHINHEELCKIYVPEIDTIKKILMRSNEKSQWLDVTPTERRNILIKLSSEIEKNVDLFTQIEIMSRGILGSDTKKWVMTLFAEYFLYYAYCISSTQKNPRRKPEGIAVGVFSNKNSLSNLSLFLAPALSAGYNVLLQVGTELAPAAFLLQDIARSVGIHEDAFRLIPSDDYELLPYLSSEKVAILALFIDLQNEKCRGFNSYHKKIVNFTTLKTPTIIFDDADLDSACESLIEASWSYQSLLPWSTNTVLVQENVLSTFLNKFKPKLRSLKVGPANDKFTDIAHRDETTTNTLSSLIDLAKAQGIETFKADENCDTWSPTLFIGGKVQANNVLSSTCEEGNELTVLAFRSIEEAVNLANNTRQGMAACVWSENIGVVNEVARKLNVGNVWVNSFGTFSPEVAICPQKDSGIGYFGGIEGLLEYISYSRYSPAITKVEPEQKSDVAINSIIVSAKKSQAIWSRQSNFEKRKIFQQFADYLDAQQQSLNGISSDWILSAIATIQDSSTGTYKDRVSLAQTYNLTSVRLPRGVISVDVSESNNIALILTCLNSGNAVILSCQQGVHFNVLKKLSSLLPTGVLNVLPYNVDNAKAIARNKLVAVHFGNDQDSVFEFMSVYDSKVFMEVTDDMEDIYNKVTVLKNVWYDSGKSSNCN
ncbi:unnamed protein product [Phaedon cochleariae]|uniref:Aldehyde dehydrogenase domain-containing protein n=1 Tax=Phaedon cochleariae TaxID=80249 RepID=A0A9P0DQB2_PHACE|nr:unnamed protein product [Phaedon cochleariae]